MKCPFCASDLSKVVDKRSVSGRGEIRRRRECLKCDRRFTTYETVARLEIMVIKKNGRREAFDSEKLQHGLLKALEKRPGIEKVPTIVSRIEGKIRTKGYKEISTRMLGKWLLQELKKLDPIAYLRFTSVYHSFTDPKDFAKEIRTL